MAYRYPAQINWTYVRWVVRTIHCLTEMVRPCRIRTDVSLPLYTVACVVARLH